MSFKKILLVDDSLTIQKVIKLALANDQYVIDVIGDGAIAIEQISFIKPDLVLVDNVLPGKNGLELKWEMNQNPQLKNIPCILMLSAFEVVDQQKIEALKFFDVLTKPFDVAQLRSLIVKVFDPASSETKSYQEVPAELMLNSMASQNVASGLELPMQKISPPAFSLESSIRLDPPKKEEFSLQEQQNVAPPMKPDISPPRDELQELTLSTFDLNKKNIDPISQGNAKILEDSLESLLVHSEKKENVKLAFEPENNFLSDEQIELLIAKKVEQHLQKKVQDSMLISLAEKLLRQEIQRILME